MIAHKIASLVLILPLMACDARPANVSSEADIIQKQIGRWKFIEARPPYPAMVFDTATGCTEPIYVQTEGENAGNLMRAGVVGQTDICDLPTAQAQGPKS